MGYICMQPLLKVIDTIWYCSYVSCALAPLLSPNRFFQSTLYAVQSRYAEQSCRRAVICCISHTVTCMFSLRGWEVMNGLWSKNQRGLKLVRILTVFWPCAGLCSKEIKMPPGLFMHRYTTPSVVLAISSSPFLYVNLTYLARRLTSVY